jgi:hypothetical protein
VFRAVTAAPSLPSALYDLLDAGVIVYVGTRSAALEPDAVMGFGMHAPGGSTEITVFIAAAFASAALADLRDNGQIAITIADPTTNRAMQLKGSWIGERRVTDGDRAFLQRYREQLTCQLALVGVPRSVSRRLVWWPVVALQVQVTEVFDQTPGPGAGNRAQDVVAGGRRA